MTDPATLKSGVALNISTHVSARLERVLPTEELCRSRPRGSAADSQAGARRDSTLSRCTSKRRK